MSALVNDNPLPEKYFPLRLVGPALKKNEMVGALAEIKLVVEDVAAEPTAEPTTVPAAAPADVTGDLVVTGAMETPLGLAMADLQGPEVLARPDVRVGLSDPRFDAAGYRAFMSVALEQQRSQAYTYWPALFRDQFTRPVTLFMDDRLATVTVPEVLETRPGSHIVLRGGSIQLLALLESGDVDYAWEYESVIRQHGLQMLALPDEVNLGSPAHEAGYGRVEVRLDFQRFASVKPVFRGERIGYGITIPASATHPAEAARFIAFLLGPEGRAIMEANHHPVFEVPLASGYEQMPAELQALCQPGAGP